MQKSFIKFSISFILLGIFLIAATSAMAAGCQKDISAVDAKIRAQYGPDYSKWWNWFGCPVCLGSELRKDAVVTKNQIKEISTYRNIAYSQLRRGDERQCVDTLRPAKGMLRIYK